MKALVIGCGYLGRRVADRWLANGHEVAVLTRSPAKAALLREAGMSPLLGDVTDAGSLRSLPKVDVVLYAVGYDRGSGDRTAVVIDGLRNALDNLRGKTGHLVFISTTGVYAQSRGEWVDEQSPTDSGSDAGRIASEAEELVRSAESIDSVILRLSGLYGPGRLLRRSEQLRAAEPIAGHGDAWLNLIHVEDAASAVILSAKRLLQNGLPARRYLVTDDRPVRRCEYYARLARLAGAPEPQFDENAATRVTGLGKRCRNDAVKHDLAFTLAFPTFVEGLGAAWTRSVRRP